jgi:hypothetical protein
LAEPDPELKVYYMTEPFLNETLPRLRGGDGCCDAGPDTRYMPEAITLQTEEEASDVMPHQLVLRGGAD